MTRAGPVPLGLRGAFVWIMTMATLTPALAEQARLEPVRFEELSGWQQDDHAAAFATFRRSCEALVAGTPNLRPAQKPDSDLREACRDALTAGVQSRSRGPALFRGALRADARGADQR